jgi:hypothetical protein
VNGPAVDAEGSQRPKGAEYSENRGFCLEPTGLSSKTTRQSKGLDAKFVTRAEQRNFFADQRISLGLTME